ncbi:MAG: Spy/CpxP family protein refolding chaperone [Caulobacter sp.]|nr:Spy/CpxP family protein refolding chaperone [Caulobacter sp.]
MKTTLRIAGLMAGAAIILTGAGAALAADPPAKPGQDVKVERKVVIQRGGPGGGMRWEGRRDPEMRARHLRDVLQLRPDQEPALQAFLAATKPQMDHMKMEFKPGADGKPSTPPKMMTTPERLDMQAKMMARHQAAFEKRAAAIKTFYAALSPSQQKAFDALHMGRMGGHRGHGMKMMHRGGPDGGPPGGMRMEDDGDE